MNNGTKRGRYRKDMDAVINWHRKSEKYLKDNSSLKVIKKIKIRDNHKWPNK